MKYFLIAGEASGDKHGTAIISSLKEKDASSQFSFLGGELMQEVCDQSAVIHIRDMAFMGFVEVLINLRQINKNFKKTKAAILAFNPDVVVMIDYPGFNLRMSKWCKENNFKVVYYISPSVWAWHKSRIETIRKYTDVMICILPFEEEFYKKHNVSAVYLGNPIYDKIKTFKKDETFKSRYNITKPILALLPGSRIQEIEKILPPMIEAAKAFSEKYEIIIAKADNLEEEIYTKLLSDKKYKLISNEYYNILVNADLGIVTSGTATLETSLFNVPQVVVYKTNPITFAIAKRIVDIKFISLPNLIADKEIIKELIQNECTSENIINELEKLISKSSTGKLEIYKDVFDKMGSDKSAEKIADKIIEISKG